MILFRLAALAALNKNYDFIKKKELKTIQLEFHYVSSSEKKITHENKLSRLRFKIL